MPEISQILAGSAAGVLGTVVGYPLDTIKARLQTQSIYRNAVDCFRQMLKNEGFFAFYRGMLAPIIGLTVLNSICFGVFGHFKLMFEKMNQAKGLQLPNGKTITNNQVAIAGGFAGFVQSLISSPIEFVKIHLQLDNLHGHKFTGTFNFITNFPRGQGRSLVNGFIVNAFRESSFGVLYWIVYENMKKGVTRALNPSDPNTPTKLSIALAGGMSGAFAWFGSFPLDLVKARVMTNRSTITKTVRHVGGPSKFFSGLNPTLLRALIVSGTRFSTYEYCVAKFKKWDKE